MLTLVLSDPVVYLFLAGVFVVLACAFLDRKSPPPDGEPVSRAEFTWNWLAPSPPGLRFCGRARGLKPGFGRDLLAAYAAGRAAEFTQALKKVRREGKPFQRDDPLPQGHQTNGHVQE